jgi:PKD repeat protein
MKKYLILLFHFELCILNCAFSQGGLWTWISGSNLPNSAGVYGIQGIPSVANHPPSDYENIEWRDLSDNLWIYGGTNSGHSDLWKFNPSTLEWTWVKGTGVYQGIVYGTQGVPDPANTPGERGLAAVTWVDMSGNFWLFGGNNGPGFKNDLWKYDPATNEWTWVSGTSNSNSLGNYGVQGVPSTLNYPGGRTEAACCWTDSLNNLWMYAGLGYDGVGGWGNLDDLWKYDISTGEWTWMKGYNTINAFASYGIKGVSNVTNDPGARFCYGKLKDASGNFWVFGGFNTDDFNDVWKYNPATNEWTWMSGSTQLNSQGNYLQLCLADTSGKPMARRENRASITDDCGRFWIFGGFQDGSGMLSDLWVFNPDDLTWKLVHGTAAVNLTGNFGTLGVPSITNIPTSRCGANAWWIDNKLYIFGGAVNSFINSGGDMWVFEPDSNCISPCAPASTVPVAQFTAPNHICPGTCTNFTNLSNNATSYLWTFNGAVPPLSTDVDPQNICYNIPGVYPVSLIATNANGSDTLTLNNFITVYPQPSPQGISQSGDTLFANQGATSYQWYYNGTIINGATDYFYLATQSGDYNVVATDLNGCEVEAVINDVLAGLTPALSKGEGVAVFPNPVSQTLTVKGYSLNRTSIEIAIYNMVGEKIMEVSPLSLGEGSGGEAMWTVDCRSLTSGLYYIEINADNKIFRSKFMKSTGR